MRDKRRLDYLDNSARYELFNNFKRLGQRVSHSIGNLAQNSYDFVADEDILERRELMEKTLNEIRETFDLIEEDVLEYRKLVNKK